MMLRDAAGEHTLVKYDQKMLDLDKAWQGSNDPFCAEYEFVKAAIADKVYIDERLKGKTMGSIDLMELTALAIEVSATYAQRIAEMKARMIAEQQEILNPGKSKAFKAVE